MVILWLPPCITDRVNNSESNTCIWEPSLNKEFVIVIATVGHHGSCFILLFCYIKVFLFMRKRAKTAPKHARHHKHDTNDCENSTDTCGTCVRFTPHVGANIFSTYGELTEGNDISAISATGTSHLQLPPNGNSQKNTRRFQQTREEREENKDKKAFITLSYIIVGYMVCWVPFHVVFDISAINPDAVPEMVYTVTFWLTYLNSTINPFLYNFSCSEFKRAFKKIMCR